MSASILCKPSRLVVFLPSLKSVLKRARTFSSFKERRPDVVYLDDKGQPESTTVWPDSALGPLGPKDKRFLLPGNVGLNNQLTVKHKAASLQKMSSDDFNLNIKDRHITTLTQFFNPLSGYDPFEDLNQEMEISNQLECVAQYCPLLVKRDFQELFSDISLKDMELTVIIFSQKTQNDMSTWDFEVEKEREEIIDKFIETSKALCDLFNGTGYWADFIDPCSGRPYFGAFTNATMFETDERYRHFGFKIEDLGCCKVISHHLWGTNAFVGCLFTNAPLNGHEVSAVVETFSTVNPE